MTDDRRVALVTGASRGIGAATALRLARDGHAVVLAARSTEQIDALRAAIEADGGDALAVPVDLTNTEAIDTLVDVVRERFGRLDVLVNNAGVLPRATRAERISIDEWNATMHLNVTAPWYLATRAKALMRTNSVVVNVSSAAAFYPSVGLLPYNTSKAALNMMTRGLALEWARDSIRVVGVAPGKIDTEMVEPILEWVDRQGGSLNPLQRIGRPDEIAELIAYLVSERAGYVTGSIVTIDGGELLDTAG